MKKITLLPLLLASIFSLSACVNSAPYRNNAPYSNDQSGYISYGTVESISWIGNDRPSSGAGAVIGGILGAIVGNQVGGGTGRTVATVAGGIGGAVVGNNLEKNRNDNYYQILIRMDGGGHQTVQQSQVGNLRKGDRIKIVNGVAYRQ
jgi:outer membrane lipoprotein SlyB